MTRKEILITIGMYYRKNLQTPGAHWGEEAFRERSFCRWGICELGRRIAKDVSQDPLSIVEAFMNEMDVLIGWNFGSIPWEWFSNIQRHVERIKKLIVWNEGRKR